MYISSHLHQSSSPPNEYPWSIFGGLKEQLCCKSKIYLQYTNQWGCLKMYRFIISSMSDSCMFHTNLGLNDDHGCWSIFLDCNWTIYVIRLYFCRHVRYHKNDDTFSPQSTLPCKTNRPFNWQWLTDSQQTQNIGINVFSASQWSAHFVGQIVLSQWRECVVVFANNIPALFAFFCKVRYHIHFSLFHRIILHWVE